MIYQLARATIIGAVLLATAAVEAYADPVISQLGALAAQKHFAP